MKPSVIIAAAGLLFAGLLYMLVDRLSPATAGHYEHWLNRATQAYFAAGGRTPENPNPNDFALVLAGRKVVDGYWVPGEYSYPVPSELITEPNIYRITYDSTRQSFSVRSEIE